MTQRGKSVEFEFQENSAAQRLCVRTPNLRDLRAFYEKACQERPPWRTPHRIGLERSSGFYSHSSRDGRCHPVQDSIRRGAATLATHSKCQSQNAVTRTERAQVRFL